MIMNGQMRKYDFAAYREQLKKMSGPVKGSELPQVKLDLKGIRKYAEKKGVSVSDLSDTEKRLFLKE